MRRILLPILLLLGVECSLADTLEQKPPKVATLSLEDAVQQVQTSTDGRILSADRVRGSRADMYRIKVLMNDGRVQVLEVDSNAESAAQPATHKARSKEKD